ncbi:MAG: MoxR family ATPase [Fibrobacter sp.]|jgi:MoxR-like ATPase|uniref:AAA family ATPase n=1 Tax=Fibrobacter sp. UWP2 TaxID=1896216 RepID=UPI000916CF5B|nr:MoxR family ATPase [Fibrobacter sp. UWP2]MBO7383018.1 MoxR family ATPase [Fibrobacter sp.]SHJ02899.1 MoxR-like ATPase [Fibrobacter sp. UWP2]
MIKRLIDALDSVLLGKHDSVEMLVMALLADGHVLIEDVPGTGKTTLAKALAAAVGADFARIQFTPDLLPADVTGGAVYKANKGDFEIRKGPVFTQVLLADEINRASPRTQSALLEAMEERQVSLEGTPHKLPELFMVLATENPVEFHGVFPLPEAQMDRFMIRLSLGYPSDETELQILRSHRESKPLDSLTAVTTPDEILKTRKEVVRIHVDEALEQYVVSLVQATRVNPAVRLAASPRAGINLVKMAQASAYVAGRDFVNPDDIQKVFYPVMEHRVFAKESTPGISRVLLEQIVKQVKIPK